MLVVGLIINNIQRQFPIYWWTPLDVKRTKVRDVETVPDGRGGLERRQSELEQHYDQEGEKIEINGAEVILPEDMSLNDEEAKILEKLRNRLQHRVDAMAEKRANSDSGRSSAEFTVVASQAS